MMTKVPASFYKTAVRLRIAGLFNVTPIYGQKRKRQTRK
ncbi:hypothetical protein RIVERRIDER_9 [Xanthomonas phage RiverRider]|uniref:Uncharacterized protein n=1 Tax=Xanthomonas phage RiverRider TaxID=2108116 RepID=A0A2P1JUR0_9CAUD|nr:hypothetical protein HWB58_gp09 [Xanthomonas phage RiverRider]AVO23097.1 hypothetical protein RIVERRIDER_9 [Xanthomonas phage RiverRider]